MVLGAEGTIVIKRQLLPSNSQSKVRVRLLNMAFQDGDISMIVGGSLDQYGSVESEHIPNHRSPSMEVTAEL